MKGYSLSYALKLWRKSRESRNVDANFEKYLGIALRFYVFPELDNRGGNLKPKEFTAYCDSLTIDKLKDALTIFECLTKAAIDRGNLSAETVNNYRSSLKRFLNWMEKQIWWRELFSSPIADTDVAPYREKLVPKSTRGKLPSYGLTRSDLPPYLLEKIESFKNFRMNGETKQKLSFRERRSLGESRGSKPKLDIIKASTFSKNEQAILRFLGWCKQRHPNLEWQLELLTDVNLLDDYTYWATTERNVSYSTGVDMVGTGIAIAKWLNFDNSQRRNWSDIPIILELQDLQSEYAETYAQQKKQQEVEKWDDKILTHPEAREVVEYLQSLCAPNYGKHDLKSSEFLSHGRRSNSAIARAFQTFLIVKFLVYCPVRQEEIRNLKLGETLLRKEDEHGNPYYVVKLNEHKRSTLTGKPRHYRLPAILTADLDLWVYKWRPMIEKSVKTRAEWAEFWGYGGGKIERIRTRLENARQGIVSEKLTNSIEEYIEQEQQRLQGAESRIAAWEIAKERLESHNYLFFILAKREPESFGTPHYVASIWRLVNRAIARATQTLFGSAKWTNPHALRHIAEAHVRLSGKSDIAGAFGTLIGHSKAMGDDYAAQVLSEYELTQDIVNDWWL